MPINKRVNNKRQVNLWIQVSLYERFLDHIKPLGHSPTTAMTILIEDWLAGQDEKSTQPPSDEV